MAPPKYFSSPGLAYRIQAGRFTVGGGRLDLQGL